MATLLEALIAADAASVKQAADEHGSVITGGAEFTAESLAGYRALLAANDPAGLTSLQIFAGNFGLTTTDVVGDFSALADHTAAAAELAEPNTGTADLAAAWTQLRTDVKAAIASLIDTAADETVVTMYAKVFDTAAMAGTTGMDRIDIAGFRGQVGEIQRAMDARAVTDAEARATLARTAAAAPRLALSPTA